MVSAQAVGLEYFTAAALIVSAIVGWLLAPSAMTSDGDHIVNLLKALFFPLASCHLWAFFNPSALSRRLVRQRIDDRLPYVRKLRKRINSMLNDRYKTVSASRLWREVWGIGATLGMVWGLLVGTYVVVASDGFNLVSGLLLAAITMTIFAATYAAWFGLSVRSQTIKLMYGRWSALLIRIPLWTTVVLVAGFIALVALGAFLNLCSMHSNTPLSLLDLRIAALLAPVMSFLLPLVFVSLRKKSYLYHALMCYRVRSHEKTLREMRRNNAENLTGTVKGEG